MGHASKKNLVCDEILNFELEMKSLADYYFITLIKLLFIIFMIIVYYSVLLFLENKMPLRMVIPLELC